LSEISWQTVAVISTVFTEKHN